MELNGISGYSRISAASDNPVAQAKRLFTKVGSALDSGDITAAKTALSQLKKIAPPSTGNQDDPIAGKMDELSKALDSGDLNAAKSAYASVQKLVSQRPSSAIAGSSSRGPRPSGPPPRGGGKAFEESEDSSDPMRIYDKMDTNKDGTVSLEERAIYQFKNPTSAEEDAGS